VRLFDIMALQMAAVTALLIIGTRFVLPWLGSLWLPLAFDHYVTNRFAFSLHG
jgi:hypothetical protein